ncbi:MAG: pyridoxamine 5'-phosphate oxidase [Bacteriovoracia bacterium]
MEVSDLGNDPFIAFAQWMKDARTKGQLENPNAMALSTVNAEGKPSVRMVLLKDFSAQGFVFFTNFDSRKGQELAQNANVALCFYWDKLRRQVRIEGRAEKLPRNQSEVYFHSRPRESQCGAWASPQSEVIQSRAQLEEAARLISEKYDEEIPMPPNWGGFCVKAEVMEFWQQNSGRLHDRIRFKRAQTAWQIDRLAP